jgi:hypothetical protein
MASAIAEPQVNRLKFHDQPPFALGSKPDDQQQPPEVMKRTYA